MTHHMKGRVLAHKTEQFDLLGGGLKKLAEIIVLGLVGVTATKIGLAPSKDLADPQNWPLWLVLAVVFGLYEIFWGPIYRACLRWRVRQASGNKLALLIARFDGDSEGGKSLRETVREGIKEQLGDAIEIVLWPELLKLREGSDADAEAKAQTKARKWLQSKRCDLLLWGRVKDAKVLSLRFTVVGATGFGHESYALAGETLDLPVPFVADLGAAIVARVVASVAPVTEMSGHYLVPIMREISARLEPLLHRSNPAFSADTRGMLFHGYALVRATIGEQSGSNDDLKGAITAFHEAQKEWTRERMPLQWATIQTNLANALSTLGERESGGARLEEALAAYREALKEWTRDRMPLEWALIQNNLGSVLSMLGERESGTARLEEAVVAYREALQERTRERMPLQWATTQNNLGTALKAIGERESGTARLEEAVAAYREALKEYKRERVPLDWAMIQNNLGSVLRVLSQRESGTARLEEAVAAYREALKEYKRERVPLDWAMTQNNLGNALSSLGEHESGAARQEEALAAYGEALKEWTRERVPLDWAMTQNNLGTVLSRLGERESGTARLEQSIAAYREALTVFEPAGAGYYIDGTRRNLARVEALLAERGNVSSSR